MTFIQCKIISPSTKIKGNDEKFFSHKMNINGREQQKIAHLECIILLAFNQCCNQLKLA